MPDRLGDVALASLGALARPLSNRIQDCEASVDEALLVRLATDYAHIIDDFRHAAAKRQSRRMICDFFRVTANHGKDTN